MKLAAVVLTYNEAAHIRACLSSLAFADECIVFDSGSTDETTGLAANAGAQVIHHPFQNYAAQRNAALQAVAVWADWVLFVDADERVTPELAAEILQVVRHPGDIAGYQIPRHNYIFGKLTRATGWYPDYQTRLLRAGRAHYDPEKIVHEVVLLEGDLGTLQTPLVHYNYRDLAHFRQKQRRYSRFEAEVLHEQGTHTRPYTPFTMFARHFWWRFVTLNGYRDGWHGLLLSLLMARYEFRKYRLLREMKG